MFKLFVIGSAQKPNKADLRKYLPSIELFGKPSGVLNGIAKAATTHSDLDSLRSTVRSDWRKWCLPGEVICESEAELGDRVPALLAAAESYSGRNVDAFVSAVEEIVKTHLPQVREAMPTLFATMAVWYSLNERHALVAQACDLIKVAALCVHFDELEDSGDIQDPDTKHAFAINFMRKAKPRINLKLPPTARLGSVGASAPSGRAEQVIATINVAALQADIDQLGEAINELESLTEAKILTARHQSPFLEPMQPPSVVQTTSRAGARVSADARRAKETALDRAAAKRATEIVRQTAAANYQQNFITPEELRTASAATAKLLIPFKDKQGAVNANSAIAQLRANRKRKYDTLLAAPFKVDVAENWMLAHGFLINVNKSVFDQITCEPPPKPCHCDLLQSLDAKHAGLPQLSILGTGTAYRIDTKFKRYVRGELVHSEPIVGGSVRTTSYRLLNRTEDSTEIFNSREEEQEQEATTDDRFKLEKEIEQETRSEAEMNMGASMSASYGSVSVAANIGMTSSTATQSKEKQAQEIAQQKTSRALSRIRTKTETRTISRRLSENERTSGFTLNNVGQPSRTAFYHAIDAEYTNQLVCIGTRTMVRVCMQEFMAPLLHMLMAAPESATALTKPIAPNLIANPFLSNAQKSVYLTKFGDITPDNYSSWLATFDITNAPTPPQEQTVSAQLGIAKAADQWDLRTGGGSIAVPSGYTAYKAILSAIVWSWTPYSGFIVGNCYLGGYGSCDLNLTTSVPWSYCGVDAFAVDIVILCRPSAETVSAWQMKVYEIIWNAYRKKLSDYENSLQMAKVEAGIAISGRNPRQNEKIVREELMKMVLGATFPQFYFRGLNAMKFGYKCLGKDEKGNSVTTGAPIPEPDFLDAKAEAPWVSFMSKLYEFENMTFDLKPYFFANRAKWGTLVKLTDVDPRMEAALRSGYVVIDVPISLGMEDAFNHYLSTGEIWNGTDMPVVGDALYEALALEVMNGQNPEGLPTNDPPWTTVLPTSLVMVSDDAPPDL